MPAIAAAVVGIGITVIIGVHGIKTVSRGEGFIGLVRTPG
jgi:hypothetical protein